MNWIELFTTYASFTTLVLLGICYFIKRVFDLKNKRIEANHSFFQQNRINAITKFFDCYGKVERMWHAFGIHKVIEREISTTELDNLIWPVMNPLKMSVMELSLYLNDEEIKPFQEILGNLSAVHRVVSDIYFKDIEGRSIELSNNYSYTLDDVVRENDKLLKEIGKQTRIMFNAGKR